MIIWYMIWVSPFVLGLVFSLFKIVNPFSIISSLKILDMGRVFFLLGMEFDFGVY